MSLDPIATTQRLQRSLVDYLMTTFDVNRDGQQSELAAEIRSLFERPNHLVKGPYLELALPYVRGSSLNQLIDEGVLTPKLRQLPCFAKGLPLPIDAPLYLHQEQAIRRIVQHKRGVVVSSGTGSGKTESFLIPLLHDLLVDTSKGVRAVLIYPLNALVNDQLDRLRTILAETEITFGRYTSELLYSTDEAEQKYGENRLPNEVISRQEVHKGKIPQILITNYAMLEYLLLRPEDSILFESGAWRFIILDEAHTYTGAQGVEVAMLLRRLKVRLCKQRGETRCIATSATLINDNVQDAVDFAATLFGEDYATEDIIFGRVDETLPDLTFTTNSPSAQQRYLEIDTAQIIQMLHSDAPPAEIIQCLAPILPEDLKKELTRCDTAAHTLYAAMRHDAYLQKVRAYLLEQKAEPVLLSEVAEHVFDKLPQEEAQEALFRLIDLGVAARVRDQAPLLPARYHVFARAPQGVWACLNRRCAGRNAYRNDDQPWSVLYATPHQKCRYCECRVYPLAVCRTCGQVYVYAKFEDESLHSEVLPYPSASHRYFIFAPVVENQSFADDEDEPLEEKQHQSKQLVTEEITLCLRCGKMSRCQCTEKVAVTLFQVQIQEQSKNGNKVMSKPVGILEQCLRCGDLAIQSTEIATPITVTGSTPISVLVQELYHQLPPSTDPKLSKLPGQGRKLLTFYDSRQGAARFAAFLQDIYKDVLYRHLILSAVKTLQAEKGYAPDFDTVAQRCVNLGWEQLRVFQSDLELLDEAKINPAIHELNRNEREKILKAAQLHILAEITTKRASRQSLESLGLLVVDYFETTENLDIAELVTTTGLNAQQLLLLIRQLLDTLRRNKVVMMPPDVLANDRIFGKFEAHPTVIRSSRSISEVPWVGTSRHQRYKLIERALRFARQPVDQRNIERVGFAIWEWLLDQTDILQPSGGGGYRINFNRLFFTYSEKNWGRCNRCQRLMYNAIELPCPHKACDGMVQEVDLDQAQRENYYFQLYRRQPLAMRAEEHTAQLTPDHGREYQDQFKRGKINVLSCSTTFEMGIDLGDLQAVVLSNVPPTVANYRQRAGRAGRRAGSAAFIFTWSQDRPHDQLYFSDPKQIIRGEVRVPQLLLDNEHIRRRHVNAVLFSAFVRYLYPHYAVSDLNKMGAFFEQHSATQPHIQQLDTWLDEDRSNLIQPFLTTLGCSSDPQDMILVFQNSLEEEAARYQNTCDEYRRLEEQASKEREYIRAQDYKNLAQRWAKRSVIDTLSDHGVLPSYSFPLHSVELQLPLKFEKYAQQLRLQRDLRDAIREYAPGTEVVADKRIWRSSGIIFERNTPRRYQYRRCDRCQFVLVAPEPGLDVVQTHCRVCGTAYKNSRGEYIQPDGFRADPNESGKPAGQYVDRPQAQTFSALLTEGSPSLQAWGNPPLVDTHYSRNEKLFYVNEGNGNGFKICLQCGAEVKNNKKTCNNKVHGQVCGSSDIRSVRLGHTITTDTLRLQFNDSPFVNITATDTSFWHTLLYALLQGASKALQIERRDIDGLLYPVHSNKGWHYSIVLYDSVPGGAGHVRTIERNLSKVVRQAYEIISTCECAPDTSCIRCLRDYYNQQYYSQLRRGIIEPYLQALLNSLESSGGLVAINQPRWLAQKIHEAQHSIVLAANTIDETPLASYDHQTWLDLLIGALRRGLKVTLILQQIPEHIHSPSSLVLRNKLQIAMNIGEKLNLYRTTKLPMWKAIFDDTVFVKCDATFDLDGDRQNWQLFIGDESHQAEATAALNEACRHRVNEAELAPPANTRVYDIGHRRITDLNELEAFQHFYQAPITTLEIYDPYLIDEERLVHCLSDHVRLAQQQGALERVHVHTADAERKGAKRSEQTKAIEKLERLFQGLVEVKRDYSEHDRFLIATRTDGTKARMIIGRGIDFIRNGRTTPTYIIVEDSFK